MKGARAPAYLHKMRTPSPLGGVNGPPENRFSPLALELRAQMVAHINGSFKEQHT